MYINLDMNGLVLVPIISWLFYGLGSSWKMQFSSTLVWQLAVSSETVDFFFSTFFQQTFTVGLRCARHCDRCWIHSKKKKITVSAVVFAVQGRKTHHKELPAQCSPFHMEKLSPSYIINPFCGYGPQMQYLPCQSEARRRISTTTITWFSWFLLPEEHKGKMLSEYLWNDCIWFV